MHHPHRSPRPQRTPETMPQTQRTSAGQPACRVCVWARYGLVAAVAIWLLAQAFANPAP